MSWCAVETCFIDGKFFGTRCLFTNGKEKDPVGRCYASLDEEPGNRRDILFGGRIELRTEWFESEQLAVGFAMGRITYRHTYEVYYKVSIKSSVGRFIKREILEVDNKTVFPYRGIRSVIELQDKPYWA